MFTTRHVLMALVAATAITGASVAFSGSDAPGLAVVKDQSRIGPEGEIQSSSAGEWNVTVVRDGKAARLMAEGSCEGHSWPYVPAPCLVVAGSEAAPGAVRTVTVEHGTLTGSVLVRVPVTQVAAQ